MQSRTFVSLALVALALIVVTGACGAGFVAGQVLDLPFTSVLTPVISSGSEQSSPTAEGEQNAPDLETLFEPFWQTWDLVHEQYVDQPVDDEALMRGAIQGMLGALGDQHTSYLDPEMFAASNARLQGEDYEGIGAWVDTSGEYLKIISAMPGSPAEDAGLRPGDQVIAVDGEDMTGRDGLAVRDLVIGPRGTTVRLTILREGETEPFDVDVQRATIHTPSVEARMLDGNVAYVRLTTFGDDTTDELRKALKDLMANDPVGLVLDLRYNGGGYLETGVDVASEFIADGVVMYQEFGDGTRKTYESRGGGLATDIPLVVLVNEGTASASEIVAGAVRDRERGQLVGVITYGKGSVQSFTPLTNDQGAVRITIARWLTPNGDQIHELGLTPDVVVEITEADLDAGRDSQLDKAVELLTK